MEQSRSLLDAAAATGSSLDASRASFGFVQLAERELEGSGLSCSLWQHQASGAEVFHVSNPRDREKCAAIMLCTPAADNRGAPHVLEHLVLCGSHKYNQGRPFFELKKSSCATFVNAVTGPTTTTYPFVTAVTRDFDNLLEVYLDCVFHPLLTPEDFAREAHDARPSEPRGPAGAASGVVYNEMRARYASPETRIVRAIRGLLYPGTPLAFDPGGHPDEILELGHGDVLDYFDAHYGSSNARIFLYGDVPIADHLRVLAPALSAAPLGRRWTAERSAARWAAPRRFDGTFPGVDDGTRRVALSWGLGDALDNAVALECKVVARVLLDSLDAPLCRAVLAHSQGRGSLFLAGVEDGGRELSFHVGVTGVEPDRVEEFEQRVLVSLERLARDLDPDRIERVLAHMLMEATEIRPLQSLRYLSAARLGWLHGGSPWTCLDEVHTLRECARRYSESPDLFSRRIEKSILNNPHRLLSSWRPERGGASPSVHTSRSSLPAAAPSGGARRSSSRASVPLPVLIPAHLPDESWSVRTSMDEAAGGVRLIRSHLETGGVNYVMVDVDVAGLPRSLLGHLPRYADAIAHMGLAEQPFEQVERRRASCLPGLMAAPMVACHADDAQRTLLRFRIAMKCLDDQTAQALSLFGELMLSADLSDFDRLRSVLQRTAQGHRAAMASNPTPCVQLRALDGISRPAGFQSLWFGPKCLADLERLSSELDSRRAQLLDEISRLREYLAHQGHWTVSFAGSDAGFSELRRCIERWQPAGAPAAPEDAEPFEPRSKLRGLRAPFPMAFVSSAGPGLAPGHADYPLARLGLHLAQFDYFLNALRTEGGAYGAMCQLDSHHAAWVVSTHSDPDVQRTWRVLDDFPAWIDAKEFTRSDLDRAIVGCARDDVRPLCPNDAVASALDQFVRGETPVLRQQRYEAMRSASPKAVKEALLRLVGMPQPRSICVMANAATLHRVQATSGTSLEVEDLFPAPAAGSTAS